MSDNGFELYPSMQLCLPMYTSDMLSLFQTSRITGTLTLAGGTFLSTTHHQLHGGG